MKSTFLSSFVWKLSEIYVNAILLLWLKEITRIWFLFHFLAVCSPQCSNGGRCIGPNSCTVRLQRTSYWMYINALYVCLVYIIMDWISMWNTYVYIHFSLVSLLRPRWNLSISGYFPADSFMQMSISSFCYVIERNVWKLIFVSFASRVFTTVFERWNLHFAELLHRKSETDL